MTDLLHSPAATPVASWPAAIVCGVDGTSESREAVHQAAALADLDARLDLHMVTRGHGFAEPPGSVLVEAQRIAGALGISADARAATDATAAAGLIRAARHADLLVVGCDALGPTPAAVLRFAWCSVLLARVAPDRPPLDTITLDEQSPARVRVLASQIAERHGSEIRLVPRAMLSLAATAIGSGLIVIADGPDVIELTRAADCSVLVVRERK